MNRSMADHFYFYVNMNFSSKVGLWLFWLLKIYTLGKLGIF